MRKRIMEFEEEFEFAYQEHFKDVFTYSMDPSRHSLEYEDINFESDYIKYYSIGIFGIPHGLSEEEEDYPFNGHTESNRFRDCITGSGPERKTGSNTVRPDHRFGL